MSSSQACTPFPSRRPRASNWARGGSTDLCWLSGGELPGDAAAAPPGSRPFFIPAGFSASAGTAGRLGSTSPHSNLPEDSDGGATQEPFPVFDEDLRQGDDLLVCAVLPDAVHRNTNPGFLDTHRITPPQ